MSTPIFDSHSHYNLDPLYSDWHTFMNESIKNDVVGAVIPGVDEESTLRGAELSQKDSYFRYAVGIHPVAAGEDPQPVTFDRVKELFQTASTIATPIAIGETGLDYFHAPTDEAKRSECIEKQQQSLYAHIRLARQARLPIIVHVRDTQEDAYKDVVEILTNELMDVPVIMHCISGPLSYVEACVNLGYFISFAGNVTYPNAHHIREYLKVVPSDKLLIETDAPYLPPQSARGQVCRPAYIRETAEYLTSLGVDIENTRANAQTLFGIE